MAYPVARDSALFSTAAALFVRHRTEEDGRCARCGTPSCHVRHRTAGVIRAAGVDPVVLVPAPRRPEAAYWRREPTAVLPVYRSDWFE
jgi:hypothetical protein